eukprot:g4554.t1
MRLLFQQVNQSKLVVAYDFPLTLVHEELNGATTVEELKVLLQKDEACDLFYDEIVLSWPRMDRVLKNASSLAELGIKEDATILVAQHIGERPRTHRWITKVMVGNTRVRTGSPVFDRTIQGSLSIKPGTTTVEITFANSTKAREPVPRQDAAIDVLRLARSGFLQIFKGTVEEFRRQETSWGNLAEEGCDCAQLVQEILAEDEAQSEAYRLRGVLPSQQKVADRALRSRRWLLSKSNMEMFLSYERAVADAARRRITLHGVELAPDTPYCICSVHSASGFSGVGHRGGREMWSMETHGFADRACIPFFTSNGGPVNSATTPNT